MYNEISKLTETQYAIINELSTCFERLNASRGVFAALHSWGDTQSDENVLQMLKDQNQNEISTSGSSARLLGVKQGLEAIFTDPSSRPCLRAFNEWKNKGYFPSVRIGKRVFIDPVLVRKAIDDKFTIHAH